MSNAQPSDEKQSFGDRLYGAFLAFLRAFVRLILILLVALVIGLGIQLGVPRVYETYVQPVQENGRAIRNLEAQQAQDKEQLSGRLVGLQERLDSLEVQNDEAKQVVASLQAELQASLEQVQSLQALQEETQTDTAGQLADLDAALAALDSTLSRLDDELAAAAESGEMNQEEIAALSEAFNATGNPISTLRRELQLVKAMELITRSRVSLGQSNFGLVEQDIQLARDLLVELEPLVFDFQQEALLAIVSRLDLALENLPDAPNRVDDDLETAWELLVAGLPAEAPPAESLEAGGSLTPTPEGTPTPEVTPTATS
jgi:hypothetical protein